MTQLPRNRSYALAAAVLGMLLSSASMLVVNPATGAEARNAQKNLARVNCGAHIESTTPGGGIAAAAIPSEGSEDPTTLLLDDNTLSYPLHRGETIFVIALPRVATVERLTFMNENTAASGKLKVAVSNYRLSLNDSKWVPVEGSMSFTGKRVFSLPMVGVEAKYVKLSFRVQKEGRIAALGLYGQATLQSFAERLNQAAQASSTVAHAALSRRPDDALTLNFANLYASARVVYVSSGAMSLAGRVIDDDVLTAFRFSTSDAHPTVIIELAENERLHRVSAVYKAEAGRVDVYLLTDLNKNPGDLRDVKPIASIADHSGSGKTAVNFDPRGARYVALRWTGDRPGGGPFEIAEISAFGVVPLSILDLNQVPDVVAQSFPVKGVLDFSNALETLANPPAIASVSP